MFYGENLKKIHVFLWNKCCLNIVLFSLIFCNCYIIVFSLVDFKPGGRGFKSRLCHFFYFLFLLFFSFSFLNTYSVFGSNIAPPPTHFFYFLNIVQYLFVPCTIPSILGSHPRYTTSPSTTNIAFTSTLTHPPHQPHPPPDHPPTPPPKKKKKYYFFFF